MSLRDFTFAIYIYMWHAYLLGDIYMLIWIYIMDKYNKVGYNIMDIYFG